MTSENDPIVIAVKTLMTIPAVARAGLLKLITDERHKHTMPVDDQSGTKRECKAVCRIYDEEEATHPYSLDDSRS